MVPKLFTMMSITALVLTLNDALVSASPMRTAKRHADVGYDVSRPQCSARLPQNQNGIAIVKLLLEEYKDIETSPEEDDELFCDMLAVIEDAPSGSKYPIKKTIFEILPKLRNSYEYVKFVTEAPPTSHH